MNQASRIVRIAAVGCVLAAGAAFAQAPNRNQPPPPLVPPKPKTVEKSPTILQNIGVGILLAGGVLAVALIPSKRGHQD